jgi:hypothetical protein
MAEKGARPTPSVHSPDVHEDTCLDLQKIDRHSFVLFTEKRQKKLMLENKSSHLMLFGITLKAK